MALAVAETRRKSVSNKVLPNFSGFILTSESLRGLRQRYQIWFYEIRARNIRFV